MAEAQGSKSNLRERHAGKRRAIIDAAGRLFAARGFERTRTRDIAQAAGIAEGTLYLYFASKRDIMAALLELVAVAPLTDYLRLAEGKPDDEVVHGLLMNRYRLWEEHGHLIKATYGAALFDADLAAAFHEVVVGPVLRLVEGYVASRVRAGAFRVADPAAAARALMSMVYGPVLLLGCGAGPQFGGFTAERYAREFTRVFLDGVLAEPQEEAPSTA